jgi:hypothetical protein
MPFPNDNLDNGNPSDTIAYLEALGAGVLASSEAASGTIFGDLYQIGAPERLCRSNAEWFGLGVAIATNKLVAAAGESTVVAVPVTAGDVISKILVPIGATAGVTVEEAYAALYEGKTTGKLLGQSKSKALAETVEKEKGFEFTLEHPVLVTPENAPGGFLYVVFNLNTVGTIPTIVSVVGPTAAVAKAIGASGAGHPPTQFAAKTGTALKEKAEAELGALVNLAYVPIIGLL